MADRDEAKRFTAGTYGGHELTRCPRSCGTAPGTVREAGNHHVREILRASTRRGTFPVSPVSRAKEERNTGALDAA